ncbi:hypothetical protein SRHO_G00231370 [Serrasalmus rhombeus]
MIWRSVNRTAPLLAPPTGVVRIPTPRQNPTPPLVTFAECILRDKAVSFISSVKGVEDIRREIATLPLKKDDLSDLCY